MVIYTLLGQATSQSEAESTEKIVTDYPREFGLPTIIDTPSRPIELPSIDTAKVVTAANKIREEVLERSVLELTTDIPSDKRRAHTVASFMHYLDDDLWAQPSQRAQDLTASDEDVTLSTLGARFVNMVGNTDDETTNIYILQDW